MDQPSITLDDEVRFAGYRTSATRFVQDTLSASTVTADNYHPGVQRIEFYEQLIERPGGLSVYDHVRENPPNGISYEEALYDRVTGSASELLVLIGGLGAGKSTAIKYLCDSIQSRRPAIDKLYPCECHPCVRKPIVVDCLDLDRTFTSNAAEVEVLMRIRREVYIQLIDEWFIHNSQDPQALHSDERKVLRRLLIANDLYHWADAESLDFPIALHASNLELYCDLFIFGPQTWNVSTLVRDYGHAANSLDHALQETLSDVGVAKRFTALVLGFWLRACNPKSPLSLVVVDNLDLQPTDNIEQIVNHLHDLDTRNHSLRLLVPLRPSSIVPHGFTKHQKYMYHYGPNCFSLIRSRLERHILLKTRAELVGLPQDGKPFAVTPTHEEHMCLVVSAYIYALICVAGLQRAASHGKEVARPNVAKDYNILHVMRFSTAATQNLAETLVAVVGTSARYAIEQLRRYFDHAYSNSPFLRQVETAGISMGAPSRIKIPFGQIISAVLGVHASDTRQNSLANLFAPTTVRANPKLPSLAKLRILAFLAIKGRVRVGDVVASLGQHGIPVEVAIEALNYLHTKNRLLLWFSRNSDLSVDHPDLQQYAVISEHGQSYLQKLAGDFEYGWFCAQQILADSTRDEVDNFQVRLRAYQYLMSNIADIDWKQLTFRRCSAAMTWPLHASEIRADEMLSLFILYSSFERVTSSSVAVTLSVREYEQPWVDELVDIVGLVADLILKGQELYEIYFGNNGYLLSYKSKIDQCKREVDRLIGNSFFERIKVSIERLVQSWTAGPFTVNDALPEPDDGPDADYLKYFRSISQQPFSREERHSYGMTLVALERLMRRRSILRNLLASRFPSYSLVARELPLLIGDTKDVRDHVTLLPSVSLPLTGWLETNLAVFESCEKVLSDNSFRVEDMTTQAKMDEKKIFASNIAGAFVLLAQRLGVQNFNHLKVLWSI